MRRLPMRRMIVGMTSGTVTMDDEPMNEQLPPPMPPPPPPLLPSWWHVPISKDRDERKLGGVVAGIARAYGFEVRTTRIAVAIAAVAIPGVIALYIAAMLLLPSVPAEARPLSAIVTERKRRPLILAILAVAVFTGFGSWAFFGGLGWGFALVAVGVVLWLSPNFGTGLGRSGTSTTWTAAAYGVASAGGEPGTAAGRGAEATPRRRRYPVQAVGLAGAALTALVMGIGNSADWWHTTVFSIVVTGLAILVGATVIGVIVNRSWFGAPMLVMLLAVSAGLLVTHPNLDGGFGDRALKPVTVADAQRIERLGGGRLSIDLTALPTGEPSVTVDAEVGYGQIRLFVPADVELRLVTRVGAGHVVVDGTEITAGMRHEDERTIAPVTSTTSTEKTGTGEAARRTITLDLEVGAGEINIEHVG